MNLHYYYWYFEKAIPERICDDIVRFGLEQEKQTALTGSGAKKIEDVSPEELKNIQQKRKSDIVWLSEKWIYKEIHPFINAANKNAGWNFDWDWSQNCQFTEYKKGQYYDWHCDSHQNPYDLPDSPNEHGKIRKLSMTLTLSHEDEYEGGDLEFDLRHNTDVPEKIVCKEIKPKGSIVVFPSFVWHRIKPVTKGTRHSLVCWNLGLPFR